MKKAFLPQFICYMLGIVLSFCALNANADALEELYEAEVEVSVRSAASRQQDFAQALSKVLLQLTAKRSLAAAAEESLQNNLHAMVKRYHYREAFDAEGGKTTYLHVQFDQQLLNKLLSRHHVALWTAKRPLIIAWLAIEYEGQRELVSAESTGQAQEFSAQLTETLQAYGVPVIFPLMDLIDSNQVGLIDVWGGFSKPLWQAAQRYRADKMLIGKLYQRMDGRWAAEWVLTDSQKENTWRSNGFEPLPVIKAAAAALATQLAEQFAFHGTVETLLQVDVKPVLSARDCVTVLQHLSRLAMVKKVELKQLTAEQLSVSVLLNSDKQSLLKSIAWDPLFTAFPEIEPTDDQLLLSFTPQ